MSLFDEYRQAMTRRLFCQRGSHLLGGAALASLMASGKPLNAETVGAAAAKEHPAHIASRAKHVIYLHMVGGPAQMDLYDYKPVMQEWFDKDLPESVRMGQQGNRMSVLRFGPMIAWGNPSSRGTEFVGGVDEGAWRWGRDRLVRLTGILQI